MAKIDTHSYDVIVIGSGGSGLRAAIAAAEAGARTAVVCKSLLGKAHTVMAEGGMAASLGNVAPEDNWGTHFQDTMFGGKYLSNWRMAELHAREVPDRAIELEHWGAVFDRTPERKMSQRAFGGHTYNRLVHIGDRTGLELIRTLQDKTVHSGIDVFMETTVTTLIKEGDRVVGCFGFRRPTGEFISFATKALVLATGGSGRIYKITSNSQDCTGDGYHLAYAAGAEMVDMEFIQFHPTGMVYPPGVAGLLVTEAVRGEGGRLFNAKGERFMEHYDPKRMELSTRDVVARSIYTEVKEGRGSPHGGAFLDVTHLDPEYVKMRLPSMYEQFKELAGVDITKEPMQVGPTCHYFMGGIKVDADTGQTCVPGLFATGEASGGMNGANRLGGNSLGDLLVFGRRAGIGAAEVANGLEPVRLSEDAVAEAHRQAEEDLTGGHLDGAENPFKLHKELQKAMGDGVGIFRDREGLEEAIAKVEVLYGRAQAARAPSPRPDYNPGWQLCQELRNMTTVSLMIAKAALLREESRGGHSRLDFTAYDDYWAEHNIVQRGTGPDLELIPTPVLKKDDLTELVEARKLQEAAA
ncbi:FAD-binding protein [Conexibacter sp. DBS9H8]|uniref:FAD-binding protein n=1 Tax=Conexibacter sp. DBS9H8 TaxID=2937801 RepID=UPI00200FDC15|nr:FAD-binding protein [Conexibacter sp. DBS9H8]